MSHDPEPRMLAGEPEPFVWTPQAVDQYCEAIRSAMLKAVEEQRQIEAVMTAGLDADRSGRYVKRKPNSGRTFTITLAPDALEEGWERESEG